MPRYFDTPIIMITALSSAEDIVDGLDAGADDYITKPFDFDVLMAKIRVFKRRNNKKTNKWKFKNIIVNFSKHLVTIDEREVSLTNSEYQILSHLVQKPGHVFTREQLVRFIAGENIHVTHRIIDTHVAGLRKKIAPYSHIVETIRGIGYKISEKCLPK